jgi:hypothetical protein
MLIRMAIAKSGKASDGERSKRHMLFMGDILGGTEEQTGGRVSSQALAKRRC